MTDRTLGRLAPRRPFFALLVSLLLSLLASTAVADVTENFDDQSDSPPFTRVDPIAVALGGGPYVTWSYPDQGDGNYAYRIVADASGTGGFAGASRGGSLDASPPSYTNFVVHIDYLTWAAPAGGANYLIGAGRESGPGTTDGYALFHEPTGGSVGLARIDDEVGTTLTSTSITLSTAKDYRLVVARSGTTLVGRVYERPDLTTPIATLSDTAATNWTDLQAGPSVASIVYTEVADATFDNFRASDGTEDFDGDGLTDLAELVTYGSSPYSTDTDGDGMGDAFEVEHGFDPADPDEDINSIVDGQDDTDGDALGNAAEEMAGTDPNDSDTDDDGLLDGAEIGTGSFGPQQVITSIADGARSVRAADVDGDGDLDVLSASENDDKISWYENTDGAAGFGAQQVISTAGDLAQVVTSTDMDGDGDLDVVAGSRMDDESAWYENTDGVGGFGTQQVISTLADALVWVDVADVDGDGDPDVLSASVTDAEIAWYENTDGMGSFKAQQVISNLASGARSVFAVDLDGDEDVDVLSGSFNDNEIAWYENTDGMGGFGAQQIITSGATGAGSVYAADLDGDGDSDVLGAWGGASTIAWYENTDGAGSFGTPQVISGLASGIRSVYAADVDGDGDLDALSASFNDDEVAWYENTDGAGGFGAQQVISTLGDGASSVAAADLDGDGDFDVLVASLNDDEVSWYEQTNVADPLDPDTDDDGMTDGFEVRYGFDPLDSDEDSNSRVDGQDDEDSDGLGNAAEELAGTNPNLADTDKDGLLDGAEIGTGSFGAQQVITTLAFGARSVFAADVDGDGDLDVLSASESDDEVAWYENTDGAGSFGPQQIISTAGNAVQNVHAADIDGDGDVDVVAAAFFDDEVAWYENTDGAGNFGGKQVISALADGATFSFVVDVDDDGDLDVLSSSQEDDEIAWYENTDGAGGFGTQQVISTLADFPKYVHAADLDGDGDTDVLSASRLDDEIAWYENTDGAGAFGAQQVISTLADGAESVITADVDGDGDLDVLSASGFDDKIAWYENTDGAGSFGAQQVISTLADFPVRVFAADVEGDGDIDVLSIAPGDNEIAWYENTDGAGGFGAQQVISGLLNNARGVFAADLDGDGDLDALSASGDDSKIAWYEQTNVADPLDPDTDDDGMSDGFEVTYGFDPLDDDEDANSRVDGQDDEDSDGLGNAAEELAGTDPNDDDSDDDGLLDGAEIGTGSFGAQQVISTLADGAFSVYAEDVDGDGDLDVLSASINDGEIAWYENTDGLGSFGAQQVISNLAISARSVYAEDLDGDGDVDVLSASIDDDKVAWYENTDGLGGFGAQQVISTLGDGAHSVYAEDLDGDGDVDVLSASYLDDEIAWYENTDGQGSFGGQQVISVLADGALSVYAEDLDRDGDLDVLSASFLDDEIAWYENTDGLGSFGAQQVISNLATSTRSTYAEDLDGDGDVDVLSASVDDDKVAWYENTDGLGGFGGQQVISTLADGAHSVYAADLDGDGDVDVLSVSLGDDKVAWYENTDGLGGFGGQQVISTAGDVPSSVYAADLDGDGDLDVLTASVDDDEIAWYEQTNVADPLDADSDDDGLNDADEVNTYSTDPLDADSDDDGLDDATEIALSTDPNDPDSEDDGICDGGLAVVGTCHAGPDVCPLVSDPGQANSDSLSSGDACQCGDVSNNGIVDATDLLYAQQHVVGATIGGTFVVTRCNLVGPEDAGVSDCNVADLAVLDRQLGGITLTLQNQIACDAWGAP